MENTIHEDYDKTLDAINTLLGITEDVEAAVDPGSAGGEKIIWTETLGIVTKNGLKAVKTIGNLKEIGREIVDTEPDEAAEAATVIANHFGGSEDAKDAVVRISEHSAGLYEAVKDLIKAKKASE